MTGRWDKRGLPHKGWTCVGVEDLGPGETGDSSHYATCEMCDQERVRYVHTMEHPKVDGTVDVGCICAGKMSGDYKGAKQREKDLKNRASRRSRWLTRTWRLSSKGNPFININSRNVGIFKRGRGWGFRIEGSFSRASYPTSDEAKMALFDKLENLKNSN